MGEGEGDFTITLRAQSVLRGIQYDYSYRWASPAVLSMWPWKNISHIQVLSG
jgi:hypothetical protein